MNQKKVTACDKVINAITNLRNNSLDTSIPYLKGIDKKLMLIQKEITIEKLKEYV